MFCVRWRVCRQTRDSSIAKTWRSYSCVVTSNRGNQKYILRKPGTSYHTCNVILTSYLVNLCQSVSSVASRQHLHSASRGLLVVPRHHLTSYGWRAFFCGRPCDMELVVRQYREIRPSAETPSSIHWRRFYFHLTLVHSALELFGWCTVQIYLLTYLTLVRMFMVLSSL